MLRLIAVLVFSFISFQASASDYGICLPLDESNPGYQAFCGRFSGYNRHACEMHSDRCRWIPQLPPGLYAEAKISEIIPQEDVGYDAPIWHPFSPRRELRNIAP